MTTYYCVRPIIIQPYNIFIQASILLAVFISPFALMSFYADDQTVLLLVKCNFVLEYPIILFSQFVFGILFSKQRI